MNTFIYIWSKDTGQSFTTNGKEFNFESLPIGTVISSKKLSIKLGTIWNVDFYDLVLFKNGYVIYRNHKVRGFNTMAECEAHILSGQSPEKDSKSNICQLEISQINLLKDIMAELVTKSASDLNFILELIKKLR
jgi:hypothetical protein